ncbi:MAG: amidohydrolase family protein, partial [Actinomycetes bacterium]
MPEQVMRKVWGVFDQADQVYGVPWPVEYRVDADARLARLRSFGVVAFTSMIYAHKPGMSAWLNEWAREFAQITPGVLATSTFFPEPGVQQYVARAIEGGARVFKVHLQVGDFDPRDRQLDDVWGMLADSGIPVVVHCGSGPAPGRFTGPGPIGEVLAEHPGLSLIVAHMGAPEYGEFLALAARYPHVRLDTTMAFTDFMERLAPFPVASRDALRDAGLRGDVLFGSDFPNIPYPFAEAVDALVRLDFGQDWLRQLLFGAAS